MAGHMCLGIFTRKCAALAQSNNVLIQSLKEGAWNNKRNYKKKTYLRKNDQLESLMYAKALLHADMRG